MSVPVVIDASAGVELLARTGRGAALRRLLPAGSVPWIPDGLFDAEVGSVLRRWDLRSVLTAEQLASTWLRLRTWRVRRASVPALHEQAWALRHNITYTDGLYVALAQTIGGHLLTADHNLTNAPTLPVPVLRLTT